MSYVVTTPRDHERLAEVRAAVTAQVKFTDVTISVELLDGRTISAPLVWFPKLAQAKKEQIENWELLGDGKGIHWPAIHGCASAARLSASSNTNTSIKVLRWG